MVSKADLKTPIAAPSQTGLRSVWQWRPLASLTPAAVADILRRAAMGDARDFLLAADDIREKDLHYRAVLQTRTLAVAGLPIEIAPADGSRAARRAADLVRDVLTDGDLSRVIAHLMDAVAKGFAVAEILWETSGSVWYPREIVPREAHWFRFDSDTGRLLRLVDGSAIGQEIPPYRMILHTPPLAAGIPLLGGVARSALWAWVFKSYALRDWARFAELFGQPIRVGKYHQGASPDDVAVLKQAAFSLGSDAAAVIPQEMVLELVESGGKSASADLYHRLIDYLDRQVSKAVLGQTMTTDDGASLAQARVHNEVRLDLLLADARAIEATLARDLIAPIVRLNLGEDAPLPRLHLTVEEPEDMAALAEQVAKLAQSGVSIPQAWVRQRFGIPEPKEGEAVIGQGAVPPAPALPPDDAAAQTRVHALDATSHARAAQEIEARAPEIMAERMAEETEAAWAEMMDAIRRIVDEAQTLEQLRDALLAAYGDLPTERLTEVMAMGFAAADLAGRLHVKEESAGRSVSNRAAPAVPEMRLTLSPEVAALFAERSAQLAPVVNVHVPEQPAPQVTVQMPETPTPEVRIDVHAPEQPAPQVTVQPGQTVIVPTHPRQAVQTVERDEMGEIVKTVIDYKE